MGSMIPIDDVYVVQGCPGGPGHPGGTSRMLTEGAVDDIVQATQDGNFNLLKPAMLVMCQCNLVELIGILARRVAEDRT